MSIDELADEAALEESTPALPAEVVPERLRAARILANISSHDMGLMCGTTARNIGDYERGTRTIPRHALAVYVRETAGDFGYFLGEGPDLGAK